MMKKMLLICSFCTLVLANFFPRNISAQDSTPPFFFNTTIQSTTEEGGSTPQSISLRDGITCSFIDFESCSHAVPIGKIPGTIDVTFGSSWLGVVDEDAGGGNGNFANEPSPDKTASLTILMTFQSYLIKMFKT